MANRSKKKSDFEYVYFLQETDSKRVKVGYSADPGDRRRQLQTGNGSKLVILRTFTVNFGYGYPIEQLVHDKLLSLGCRKVHGEWFILKSERNIDTVFFELTHRDNKEEWGLTEDYENRLYTCHPSR